MKKNTARCGVALLIYILIFVRAYGCSDVGTAFYMVYWPLDFMDVNRMFLSYTMLVLSQLPLYILWGDYFAKSV